MSYCRKCGAYIPDGQEVCLACGFDEAAEKKQQNTASSSAYAYEQKTEAERRAEEEARRIRAEINRRKQQELNRKWAESEQRRRQMQEEFERSKAEAAARAREQEYRRTLNEDGYATLHRNTPSSGSSSYNSDLSISRVFSYMSYFSFLCFLPTLLGIEDPFTRFHAKQGRKLFFASLVMSFIPGINAIAWLFQIALAIVGLRNVHNGVMAELPVVGRLGEK